MFFRNLTLFRFHDDTAVDLARLADVLPEHALRPCGPLELFTRGFVPPVGRDDDAPLTHTVGHCTTFAAGGEDKLLPPAVLNEALHRKVQKIAEEEDRKVGGRERKRLKEDLLTEMLPRAFVCSSRLAGYIDTTSHWLVIDTASRKAAENTLTQLREALGSFPAVPLAPEESPRILMTDWLANGNLPAGFALGDECELRDPATATGAIAKCGRQDLDSEEVKEHLRNGKQVFKLGLIFDDRLSFVLGEDLVVRKLKFLDVVVDQLGDGDYEDATSEFMATMTLMTLELQRLFARLDDIFKLNPDAPLHLHGQEAPASMRTAAADASKLDSMLRKDGTTATLEVPDGKVLATFGDGPDPLTEQAVQFVRRADRASISGVQRHLRIGYNRAARLIEDMEKRGVVSMPDSHGARHVLIPE
jgi:recombination associated protein RdgC